MPSMGNHSKRQVREAAVPVLADPHGVITSLNRGAPGQRSRWQAIGAGALITLIALGLAAYAAAASYESVSALAAAHHVPLARLNPAGIDGGLFGVILIDIVLTSMGQPLGWLRLAARLFAAGTIAANFAAGWPDPAGIGLRIAAPALFVILTEVARAVLLRRLKAASGEQKVRRRDRDKIPLARWFLAFGPTRRLWRRMKLWDIASYREALAMEMRRQRAMQSLAVHYKTRDWRGLAPSDLVWMLDGGLFMDDALAQVAALVAPPATPEEPPAATPRTRQRGRPKAATPDASDLAAKRAKAKRLLSATPPPTLADVKAKTGLSERTLSRIKSGLPRRLHVAGE